MLHGRAPLFHRHAYRLYGLGKPDKDRLADEEMADVEFDDLWQGGDDPRGLVIEAMAGVTLEPERLALRGCGAEAAEFVIGFGGYSSVPTMLAAASLGLPTMLHEQNAVLGRANRLLVPRVRRIATGFPETSGLRPAYRARSVHTGNPVRPAVLAIRAAGYRAPAPEEPIELLILGGSQGARVVPRRVERGRDRLGGKDARSDRLRQAVRDLRGREESARSFDCSPRG